jgi:membrane associated rhomboid family serine protease
MFSLTPTVRAILIINLLVFFVPSLMGSQAFIDQILGLHHIYSEYFGPWQWLTHMFVHANFNHLLFNMIGFIVFAPMLERVWGSGRFLTFYLICGLGAGFLYSGWSFVEVQGQISAFESFEMAPTPGKAEQFFLNYYRPLVGRMQVFIDSYASAGQASESFKTLVTIMRDLTSQQLNRPMVGASGAIYGVLIGFGLLFPNTELMLLFPPIPIKAKYMVGFYAVTALYGSFANDPSDSTAHFAHVGGMIFGAIMVYIWRKDRRYFY